MSASSPSPADSATAGASQAPHGDAMIEVAIAALRAAGCAGEAGWSSHDEWSAQVRKGEIEKVEGASTSGLRVTAMGPGNRRATCSTSDTAEASVRATAAKAIELSAYGDADAWAGLPPAGECGLADGDLDGDDPAYASLDHDRLIRLALDAERIAFAVDPRITNSHRSGVSASRSVTRYASTAGTRVAKASTAFGCYASVVAQDAAGERQSGGYGTSARRLAGLKPVEVVGGEAGARAIRGFGWRKIRSGPTRVLLHRDVASSLLGMLVQAVSGGAVYRGSTFLASKLGQDVAAPAVTVIDEPMIRHGLASRPCDGEGVRSRVTRIVDGGRLVSFLVDGYAARRLSHPYTGHLGGHTNVRLVPGRSGWDDLLRELGTGLVVHQFHGHGVDIASGTISKGISGSWVENGRVAHPVQEVTVAAHLAALFAGIRAIGDDPLDQTSVSSPSLLVDGFTVGGT